jgi:predicted secreted protein
MPEPNLPGEIVLRVGEEATLELPSLAGAGYVWEYELGDPELADVDKHFAAPAKGGGRAASFELLRLCGRRAGTTALKLWQRRSWEPKPIAEHVVRLTVLAPPRAGSSGKSDIEVVS